MTALQSWLTRVFESALVVLSPFREMCVCQSLCLDSPSKCPEEHSLKPHAAVSVFLIDVLTTTSHARSLAGQVFGSKQKDCSRHGTLILWVTSWIEGSSRWMLSFMHDEVL